MRGRHARGLALAGGAAERPAGGEPASAAGWHLAGAACQHRHQLVDAPAVAADAHAAHSRWR